MAVFFLLLCFGSFVGSFINVYRHRFIVGVKEGRKENIFYPHRSYCPQCRKTIYWYHNIPLLSYFFLKGRCAFCECKISFIYPCVELISAFITCLVFYIFRSQGLGVVCVGLFFSYFLLCIFFIDFQTFLIPDFMSVGGCFFAIFFSFVCPKWFLPIESFSHGYWLVAQRVLWGIIVGGGACFLIRYCATLVFKKEAMGFGDVKMMAMVCAFLGAKSFLVILFIGSLSGTLIYLPYFFSKKRGLSQEIPFGPHLALASFIVMCFKEEVFQFFFRF